MITYYKSYYWLIRFRYFIYTVSPSWTYPSSGRYSLDAVAMHLLKLWCSLCCSPEYLQLAFFVLLCKTQEKYFLPHVVCDWFASLEKSPRFRVRPAQYWIWLALDPCLIYDTSDEGMAAGSGTSLWIWFAPIVKWSTRPHGLFALPAALHALERTCYFKHCSYVTFTSNTDEN